MKKPKVKVDVERASSIRVSNKTREMLTALAKGNESQEDVILRLIKQENTLNSKDSSIIIPKGDVIGTKYNRKNKTIEVWLKNEIYSVVCTFNDLSIMSIMSRDLLIHSYLVPNITRYRSHISSDEPAFDHQLNKIDKNTPLDWELDLEIVNVRKFSQWQSPSKLEPEERRLLYFACVKRILEETFYTHLYGLVTEEDFLDVNNWIDTYNRNNFSRDSLNTDIVKKMELKRH